jgi:excisionase family DNA binding protein
MSDRLEAALAELAAAIRDELRAELAERAGGPPELLSIPAAAERLSIGRTALYDAIGRGEVRSVKVGRRRLVPFEALGELTKKAVAAAHAATARGDGDATADPRRPAA